MRRTTDRPQWADLDTAFADRARPARPPARSRTAAIWRAAGWLALNLALIGVSAYLYAFHIIPKLQAGAGPVDREPVSADSRPKESPSAGCGGCRKVPILTRADLTAPNEITLDQESWRPRSEPLRANYTPEAAKTLGYECIGDVAYTKKIVDGVIVVQNEPAIRCR